MELVQGKDYQAELKVPKFEDVAGRNTLLMRLLEVQMHSSAPFME